MVDYVVIGLGKTGLSCVDYLLAEGHDVVVCDTRACPPNLGQFHANYPNVPIHTGELPREILMSATTIVVSPGVSLDLPLLVQARAQGIPCVGDVELFVQSAKAPIIAITGTNGKTTTTTLVGELISQAGFEVKVGGNIGEPVLNFLRQPVPDYYVLELSSFQLESTSSLKARVAVILNLSPDHMDRYPSYAAYRQAKQRIYAGCQAAVVNADEPALWCDVPLPEEVIRFSTEGHAAEVMWQANQTIMVDHAEMDAMPLVSKNGLHPQNVCVVIAIGQALDIPLDVCCEAIAHFQSLSHRCQLVMRFQEVDWYNDSKATNAGAVIAAMSVLGPRYKKIVWIAGGDAKDSELDSLIPVVQQYVSQAYLIGQDAVQVHAICEAASVPAKIVSTMAEAVQMAALAAEPGDAVVLSPACASWDMFKNYEDRGDQFMDLVHAAAKEAARD